MTRPERQRPGHGWCGVDFGNLKTMTYEVTDRVARITFNRPEKGNAIVAETPLELAALVERADLDPGVHVMLVSGRGAGFRSGFDLSAYADRSSSAGGAGVYEATVLDGQTQAVNHLPNQPWDPMTDYQMMSRFVRGFASLMRADKPTVVKIHEGHAFVAGAVEPGFGHAVWHRDEPFGDLGRRTSGV